MTHICVIKLTIIGSDNGLSPDRHQSIIWTNAEILLIGLLGTNFIAILIGIQTFSFKKMHLKMSSAKWHPFCFGLNVLNMLNTGYNTYPMPMVRFSSDYLHLLHILSDILVSIDFCLIDLADCGWWDSGRNDVVESSGLACWSGYWLAWCAEHDFFIRLAIDLLITSQ